MKFLKWLTIGMIASTLGCSACIPNIKSDSAIPVVDTYEADPYPWVTWEECSQVEGAHPCNFTLQDQNGDEVSLYDFGGFGPIVLDLSAMWCAPCNNAADEVQEVQDRYSAEGLTYMTVLIETYDRSVPTSDDCKEWADDHNITSAPVLAGSRDMIDYTSQEGWYLTSWPTFFFITDDMVLHARMQGFSASYLDSLIQDTIAQ